MYETQKVSNFSGQRHLIQNQTPKMSIYSDDRMIGAEYQVPKIIRQNIEKSLNLESDETLMIGAFS